MAEKMMRKAPLRCRIPAKIVGVPASAIFSGCAYGQQAPIDKCKRCPYYADTIRKAILSTDEFLKQMEEGNNDGL